MYTGMLKRHNRTGGSAGHSFLFVLAVSRKGYRCSVQVFGTGEGISSEGCPSSTRILPANSGGIGKPLSSERIAISGALCRVRRECFFRD